MSITLLPTPPSRQDPNNFAIRADAFLGALPTFGTEANALATTINTNATNAAASATNAALSATAANASAIAANTSAAAAAGSFDSFDDRYLGSKSLLDPTVDNDNSALLTGALYWNSTASEMRVYNGTAWVAVQTTSAATNAASSATAAASSATAAASSATNAASSATAAAASFDSFDDRYLGAKTADPSTDNDSQTLLVGAVYFNSTALEMRVWNGTAWVAVQTTSAATNAAASATAAASSAASADSFAILASGSAIAASNAFDSFDDRYLGAKSSAPTVDNDGQPLLAGALYWNTTNNTLFVRSGTNWVAPVAGVSTFNNRNGSVILTSADVVNVMTASTNFTAGTISATDFNSTSDQRLKTNVSDIDPQLLAGICPVAFEWKESKQKSYGVIAQELQKTMPELVHTRPDGLLEVSYTPIIALLVQAVKDLQDKVAALQSR